MEQALTWFLPWEERLIVWMQHLGEGTVLQTILFYLNNFFSFLGEEMICIVVLGVVYWGIDKKKGELIGAAVLYANVSIGLLKNIFARVRPWAASDNIELLREVDGFSFPSGHSANCTTLYPTTAYAFREKKGLFWAAIFVPLFCGISRCYVGAHWPTDVIVGWAAGLVIFICVTLILGRIKNKYIFYLIMLAIGSVGFFYCKTNDFYNSYGMILGFTAALWFEERYVKFENTKNPWLVILRTLGGCVLYFGLSAVLKLAIGGIFPEGSYGYLLMRTVRYALILFVLIGVYPFAFRLEKKRSDMALSSSARQPR
ncbi:MAG: phosphatase PAP2 family protein [Lachnospiraceae bacterium]|nr:phosphatase PAP2 family protein [Lachnospiraceae bacterium]